MAGGAGGWGLPRHDLDAVVAGILLDVGNLMTGRFRTLAGMGDPGWSVKRTDALVTGPSDHRGLSLGARSPLRPGGNTMLFSSVNTGFDSVNSPCLTISKSRLELAARFRTCS